MPKAFTRAEANLIHEQFSILVESLIVYELRCDISVIVPVHNGGNNFTRCLRGLLGTSPPPAEIIVVSDGDTNDSGIEVRHPRVRVIREPVRRGPARARNQGALQATGNILLFIDADVEVPSDLIGRVAAIFDQDRDLAAIIGSYDDEPAWQNFFSQYKNLFHHFTHQHANDEASTFWGACGAIRRDIFLAAGGFDEGYHKPCIEDIELGYRLRASGHRMRLVKALQVKHLKHWGLVSLLKSDVFCRALPWTELILRYGRFNRDLILQTSSRISVLAAVGMAVTALGAFFHSSLWILSFAFLSLIIFLNRSLLRFFHQKHGLSFAAKAAAWHCCYYFYCGLAFAAGVIRFYLFRHLNRVAAADRAV